MTKFFGLDFAPLCIPMPRRLQTLAVLIQFTLLFQSLAFTMFVIVNPFMWPITAIYFVYMHFDRSYENGGRPSKWFRNLPLWHYLAAYFPVTLHREQELDSSRKYILGYHPHGILSSGAVAAFATDALGVEDLFPGIQIHLLGMETFFRIPFYRDIAVLLGCSSVSKTSIKNILSKGPGKACLIVVGGAQEALLTKPELSDLVIKDRRGFVRMAMTTGADLVPVFGFGENQIFDQAVPKEGSIFKKFQDKVKSSFGFTFPYFYGRNVFTYNFGLLPLRKPINIIGKSSILQKLIF
ncbi:diacylglycerol O-acyltransferase 1 [Entomophthora muscae]|uniref:Diacylglycerol O-acyltransferase 1 n=1 Tax=Entomophthora muscae TaxID=34485 RepID=A0ACC2RKT4_9FUNG|nr:diacylglycerol O-acyltransferase 1 [Entomophthora muscae]